MKRNNRHGKLKERRKWILEHVVAKYGGFPAKLTAVSESAVFGIAVSGILPIDVHVLRVVRKPIAVVYDPTLQGRLRRHSYNTNTVRLAMYVKTQQHLHNMIILQRPLIDGQPRAAFAVNHDDWPPRFLVFSPVQR